MLSIVALHVAAELGAHLDGIRVASPGAPAAALRVLNLNNNRLYGSIPKDLARLTSLEQLLLGGNRCAGTGCSGEAAGAAGRSSDGRCCASCCWKRSCGCCLLRMQSGLLDAAVCRAPVAAASGNVVRAPVIPASTPPVSTPHAAG